MYMWSGTCKVLWYMCMYKQGKVYTWGGLHCTSNMVGGLRLDCMVADSIIKMVTVQQ